MALSADFELGTLTNAVLAADPGSATAWDAVNDPGAGSCIYDNTHVYGLLAAKFITAATGSDLTLEWSTALGTVTDQYGRFYMWPDAFPTGANLRLMESGAAAFHLQTDGTFTLLASGIGSGTGVVAVATGQWIRVEYHFVHSITVGQIEVKFFNNAASTTPSETITSAADKNTGANATWIRHGDQGGSVAVATFWLDNIIAGATSYPGPIISATANLAPVIYGRGAA